MATIRVTIFPQIEVPGLY